MTNLQPQLKSMFRQRRRFSDSSIAQWVSDILRRWADYLAPPVWPSAFVVWRDFDPPIVFFTAHDLANYYRDYLERACDFDVSEMSDDELLSAALDQDSVGQYVHPWFEQ